MRAMALHRLWVSISSILTGWTVLLLIYYLLERPLLLWTGPIFGGAWFATASLALECCAPLAATGWVIGLVCGWMIKRRAPIRRSRRDAGLCDQSLGMGFQLRGGR